MNKLFLLVFFILPMLTFSQEKTISGEQIIENYLLNLQAIDNLKGKITIIENRISTLNPSDSLENITILNAKQRVLDFEKQIIQKEKISTSIAYFIFEDIDSPKRPIIVLNQGEFEMLPESKKEIIQNNPTKFEIKQI
ncbi:MAG: hypothetical protein RLZ33_760 [Bacteroidota bacterium]